MDDLNDQKLVDDIQPELSVELEDYRKDKRFRIIDVLYTDSKGVCWARNLTQQL